MEQTMKEYFDRLVQAWHKFNNSYPRVSWIEGVSPFIYIGELDDDKYTSWTPVKKNELSDFTSIENEFGIKVHDSVKQYFNSYWFAQLSGFYNSNNIILEPVLPGKELNNFYVQMVGYREIHEGKIENIPIGFEGNTNFLVVIDNVTGNVKLEDYEKQEASVISPSLEMLISQITFNN